MGSKTNILSRRRALSSKKRKSKGHCRKKRSKKKNRGKETKKTSQEGRMLSHPYLARLNRQKKRKKRGLEKWGKAPCENRKIPRVTGWGSSTGRFKRGSGKEEGRVSPKTKTRPLEINWIPYEKKEKENQ